MVKQLLCLMLLTAPQAGQNGKRRGMHTGRESVHADLDQAIRADVAPQGPSLCQPPQQVETVISRHTERTPSRFRPY